MASLHLVWREIRILTLIALTGFLLLLIATGIVALQGRPPDLQEFLALGIIFIFQLVIGFFLKRALCPNCRKPFFLSPVSSYVVHPLTPNCQLCGVQKYSELSITTDEG